MLKRISSIVFTLLILSASSFAMDLYVKVGAGASSVKGEDNSVSSDIEFSNESIYTLAIGTKIDSFDIELEYAYEKNNFKYEDYNKDFKGKANNLILNAFYNFDLDYIITPYVGLGLGYAKYKTDGLKDSYFVYQGMLGAKYALSKKVDLGIEYRYKDTNSDFDFKSNNLLINAVYKF